MHSYPRPRGDRLFTVDEFERLPEEDDAQVELVRGRLIREPLAGFAHGDIGSRIVRLLGGFVAEHGLGCVVGADTGFILSEDPATVRAPDVAFVAETRLPAGGLPMGFWRGAPDLAVEVLSPSNTRPRMRAKVSDYLAAGCRMVWVVDPRSRTVAVYRPGAAARVLGPAAMLDGDDVIPGFRIAVAELFAG